uniref:NADH-ubiquinone oxidoreductase chain 5 n=1 Tax=Spisula sachalinensis TaxID=81899 RepID=A0A2H4U8Z6_SPISA|nr:NADH dehydrogenase subunit 5 [Pseudocardium sachalinense]
MGMKFSNNELLAWGLQLLLMSFSAYFFWMFLRLSSLGAGFSLVIELTLSNCILVEVSYPVLFDWVSCLFVASVCYISSWVMVYSSFYMSHEIHFRRFCFLVLLFVVAMNLLILNPSMLTLMVGWDGLGVVSFLLVVYYMDSDSYAAGMLTIFSNRVGDVLFIIFISVSCAELGFDWYGLMVCMEESVGMALGACIVLGSMTKSAQVPFSAWLPAAMAAPTPVSALVHSSTLVTAGVYISMRYNFLISGSLSVGLLCVSLLTFYLAGLGALVEMDIKKLVALSTLSQVSMMMMAISMGFVSLAFFHLLVHAFFKALMFLCVGAIMSMSKGVQDIRSLSKMPEKLPVVSSWLVVSVMCLCGVPFMSGFYSKDVIVEGVLGGFSGGFLSLLILGTVLTTSAYSFRMLALLFKDAEVGDSGLYAEPMFSNVENGLAPSLFGLGFMALISGRVLPALVLEMKVHVELDFYWKSLILLFFVIGMILGCFLVFHKSWHVNFVKTVSRPVRFLNHMFFLSLLSGWWLGSKSMKLISGFVMNIENFWITKVVWSWGVGKVAQYLGTLSRSYSENYLNMLVFVSLNFLLSVFLGYMVYTHYWG